MAIQAKKQSPWLAVLLIIAAVAVWFFEQKNTAPDSKQPRTERSAPAGQAPVSDGKVERQGGYEVYRNCQLAADKNNDGDSFRVRLPDGRQEIFRLYFVDTPESAFKSYRGGDTNHQRISEQADYFNISSEEAVEIGKQGKHFTLDLLGSQPFTIFTQWDSPFNDQRYHAFIEVNSGGKKRWLHEVLVEKGFARLKTKPADLPDGTSAADHRRRLETQKQAAEKNRVGAWAR
jgi:endonuclease YncB( thermonuclease family)